MPPILRDVYEARVSSLRMPKKMKENMMKHETVQTHFFKTRFSGGASVPNAGRAGSPPQ